MLLEFECGVARNRKSDLLTSLVCLIQKDAERGGGTYRQLGVAWFEEITGLRLLNL
jgi:hypothetical protein